MQRVMLMGIVVILVLAGLGVPVTSSVVIAQQDASTRVQHPIVGAWFWENISEDPFDDSYALFGEDGTYVEETAYIGAGIGSWNATGDRSADLLIVFQDIEGGLDPDKPAAVVPGTLKFWLSLEVSADGNHLIATGPVEARSSDGTLEYAFEFTGSATRLGLDWVQPATSQVPGTAKTQDTVASAVSAAPSAKGLICAQCRLSAYAPASSEGIFASPPALSMTAWGRMSHQQSARPSVEDTPSQRV